MSATLVCGDVRAVLATLPERSVQTVVTSPPYWGLRDYGTSRWDGGAEACDHIKPTGTILGKRSETFHGSNTQAAHRIQFASLCGKCGARRVDNQLGLERTPEAYVASMVDVFRGVRRVLRDDGTLWLNLGDSYTSGGRDSFGTWSPGSKQATHTAIKDAKRAPQPAGLKPKDLVGIPWRVAFALQGDGWYLRSDIIWAKPNPMPESVTDRPTKAHEYLFLLTKQERYYFDSAAIAEPATEPAPRFDWDERKARGEATRRGESPTEQRHSGGVGGNGATRNARTVWTIATQPYSGAHFATFPEELARRCILAGSRPDDTVLDPFGGSGTTASVAVGHGRRAIHIDLNPAYLELARQRIGPMLCEDAPASEPDAA